MKVKRNLALSDSGFLFNPSTGDSFSINPIGQEIFHLLKEGKSQQDIEKYILENYMTDKDTVEKDFYDFTVMLKNFKLVEDNE